MTRARRATAANYRTCTASDDRLPATLCRAAWSLKDGQHTTDVVETQYGYHFIRRLSFHQPIFILFTDDAIPSIRIVMRRAMQERLLLGAREKAKGPPADVAAGLLGRGRP